MNPAGFRAVGGRCAVDMNRFTIDPVLAMDKLSKHGFEHIVTDPTAIARSALGRAEHRYAARPSLAPAVVDCTSYVKWVFAQCGIWLPRRAIQQRHFGADVPTQQRKEGDLVFRTGYRNRYLSDPLVSIGHVGLLTSRESVIQAVSPAGVIEVPWDQFVTPGQEFRGVTRIIPAEANVVIFKTPPDREVECEDDVRWLCRMFLYLDTSTT